MIKLIAVAGFAVAVAIETLTRINDEHARSPLPAALVRHSAAIK